jgi:hypothetical protein
MRLLHKITLQYNSSKFPVLGMSRTTPMDYSLNLNDFIHLVRYIDVNLKCYLCVFVCVCVCVCLFVWMCVCMCVFVKFAIYTRYGITKTSTVFHLNM